METALIETAPLIDKVSEAGALASFMLLVILALFSICVYLMKDTLAERNKTRESLSSVAVVIAELKEIVRGALSKN